MLRPRPPSPPPAALAVLLLASGAGFLGACGGAAPAENVLIVLVDDLGPELLACYGEGGDTLPMPRLDRLAAEGVRFTRAWANPLCSPTRAAIQTGRYGVRTGIGSLVLPDSPALPLDEITLPELLERGRPGTYATAAFGKWHLGNERVGGLDCVRAAGYGHYAGCLWNLVDTYSYTSFDKIVDGVLERSTTYATTDTTDSALSWIGAQRGPWLAYVAYHAMHAPYHVPPAHLHDQDLSEAGSPAENPVPYARAMAQALDAEIGRLLDGIGAATLARTTVILLSDNGSAGALDPEDSDQAKGSLFEGGLRVPLIVRGPRVVEPGRSSDALVHVTDVFATAAELAGVDAARHLPEGRTLDAVSLLPYLEDPDAEPVRRVVFAERFHPNLAEPEIAVFAVRNARHKLIRQIDPPVELLFDLEQDPGEETNLLAAATLDPEARTALRRLSRQLDEILEGEVAWRREEAR